MSSYFQRPQFISEYGGLQIVPLPEHRRASCIAKIVIRNLGHQYQPLRFEERQPITRYKLNAEENLKSKPAEVYFSCQSFRKLILGTYWAVSHRQSRPFHSWFNNIVTINLFEDKFAAASEEGDEGQLQQRLFDHDTIETAWNGAPKRLEYSVEDRPVVDVHHGVDGPLNAEHGTVEVGAVQEEVELDVVVGESEDVALLDLLLHLILLLVSRFHCAL